MNVALECNWELKENASHVQEVHIALKAFKLHAKAVLWVAPRRNLVLLPLKSVHCLFAHLEHILMEHKTVALLARKELINLTVSRLCACLVRPTPAQREHQLWVFRFIFHLILVIIFVVDPGKLFNFIWKKKSSFPCFFYFLCSFVGNIYNLNYYILADKQRWMHKPLWDKWTRSSLPSQCALPSNSGNKRLQMWMQTRICWKRNWMLR